MVSKAAKDTRTTDPVKIAFALEGMKIKAINGEVEMRAADHQLQQPLYISTWAKVDGNKVKYDQENTGYGWSIDQKVESYVAYPADFVPDETSGASDPTVRAPSPFYREGALPLRYKYIQYIQLKIPELCSLGAAQE